MSDDRLNVPGPPRFPCVAAFLCAACLGASAWTWMRYSYCWDVRFDDLYHAVNARRAMEYESRYVEIKGRPHRLTGSLHRLHPEAREWPHVLPPAGGAAEACSLEVCPKDARIGPPDDFGFVMVTGRLTEVFPCPLMADYLKMIHSREEEIGVQGITVPLATIDTDASRFHPASTAGLVVGAMGVFVFTVSLRHWLGERHAVG